MEQHDEQTGVTEKPSTTPTKSKNPMIQFFAGLLIVVVVAVLGVFVYTKSQVRTLSETPFVMQAATALRVPIAKIDGKPVLYSEFVQDLTSLERFYSNQPDGFPIPTAGDISEQVLSRLFINQLIAELGEKYSIVLEEADMSVAKAELLSQFPDEATAATEIENTFGWSFDTFTNRVIRPIVLEQKVSEAFAADDSIEDAYTTEQIKAKHILFLVQEGQEDKVLKKAQEVLDRIKNGEDFAELAKEFGEDGTAEAGGDLGWIDRGVTVPSFEAVLFALEPGELHQEVAETEFGYHIIQADEKQTTNDFARFFQDKLEAANVKIFADLDNPFAVEEQVPSVTEGVEVVPQEVMDDELDE